MKKFFKKENRGITLVALVITIIILLILAAISIQALTNQGLFGRTNDAKRESEIASIKEQIALDIYEKQLTPPVGSITDAELETILGKYGTVNKGEDGTIIGITTAKGYEILLKDIYGGETVVETVPDGAIVTPVNDITTWLKTGGISKQYSYTTIEQVIADNTCTESLMNNENAMKYLARSTEFANAICASETAMTYLGQSAYVNDTVLNSDVWDTNICDSAHFESVLLDKVPTMTSNTTPFGEAIGYDYQGEYYFYKAFDNDTSTLTTGGMTTSVNNFYIGYKFTSPICIKKLKLVSQKTSAGWFRHPAYDVQASNNGYDWDTLIRLTTTYETQVHNIPNENYYLYYRIANVEKPMSTATAGTLDTFELQFYGRFINVK